MIPQKKKDNKKKSNSDTFNYEEFEKNLLSKTDEFLSKIFVIRKSFESPLYHFTSKENADSIIKSQQLRLSFIRSTSDPLEFALPLAECRDYLCIHTRIDESEFPVELFKFFNSEAVNPDARPYFMSFTYNPKSLHHKKMYGTSSIVVSPKDNFDVASFEKNFFFIKCIYKENIGAFAHNTIQNWFEKILKPTAGPHSTEDLNKILIRAFWILIKICHTISLGTKAHAFKEEDEYRLVLYSQDVDLKQNIYSSRKQKKAGDRWSPAKEYIILNLKKAGLEAKIFEKS